jgi:tetratricopeptide (TPR) repeat protein
MLRLLALVAALLGNADRLSADQAPASAGTPLTEAQLAERAKKIYLDARSRWEADTNSLEAGWKLGQACFDFALAATNNADRAKSAEEGIAICRRLLALKADLAQAHYFLGLNLGELADTKRNLSGLRMVNEMEREVWAAHDLDEQFDNAGPDRILGLLYWQAPSIISVGSRSKARKHLQRAAELAPDFPENRLNLIEAYTKWGERANAWRELRALEKLWPSARQKLTGDEHVADWADWDKRLNAIKKKYPDPDVHLK